MAMKKVTLKVTEDKKFLFVLHLLTRAAKIRSLRTIDRDTHRYRQRFVASSPISV